VFKSTRTKWAGHLACINILVKKGKRKRRIGRPSYLKKRWCEDMDWMILVQD
jgi:hypothetical protein